MSDSGPVARRQGKVNVRHAIIGFLTLGPVSGYDLKRAFDRTIGYAWNAYDSQIYTELRKLETEKLVEAKDMPTGARGRRVYSLTEEGVREFDEWLASELEPSFTRDEFLLRLFFFQRLDPQRRVELLRAEITRLSDDIELTRRTLAPFEARDAARRHDHPLHWQLAAGQTSEAMNRARRARLQELLADAESQLEPEGEPAS